MSQKSMLDQILDILEKWEEEVPVEKPRQEASFTTQKKAQEVGQKEKAMLMLWTLSCFLLLMIIPSLFGYTKYGMNAVISVVLSLTVYFVLFMPALYWYLNKAGKDKRWLFISIFPLFALLFVIYLVGFDQTDKKVVRGTSPDKRNFNLPETAIKQKNVDFLTLLRMIDLNDRKMYLKKNKSCFLKAAFIF